jgi:hypothetical protein
VLCAEIFVTAYIVTYGMEKVRQLFSMEPSTLGQKWRVWVADSKWHPLDLAGIFFFLLGFLLRLLIYTGFRIRIWSAWIRIYLSCRIRIQIQVYKLHLNFEDIF